MASTLIKRPYLGRIDARPNDCCKFVRKAGIPPGNAFASWRLGQSYGGVDGPLRCLSVLCTESAFCQIVPGPWHVVYRLCLQDRGRIVGRHLPPQHPRCKTTIAGTSRIKRPPTLRRPPPSIRKSHCRSHVTPPQLIFVKQSLNNLKASVTDIKETCDTMQAHTKAAYLQISQSLADAGLLQSRRDQIGTKHTILSAFQKAFTLPDEQVLILTSVTEPVDQSFFQVFDKVKSIHSNCQSLLTTENHRAGYPKPGFCSNWRAGLRLWNR